MAIFAVLAVAAGAYLLHKGAGNTFFYDDWSWVDRGPSGLHWILSSYNNHMLIAAKALYELLLGTVGLAHYWVFRVFATLAHLSCATAVFVYARRRIGQAALLVVLPVLLLGSGWEYVLEPVNVGFVTSLTLSICALLALDRGDRRGDLFACVMLVLALACSEFSVVFMLAVAVELSVRDRSARRAWVWATPLVLYALWWLGYHEATMAGHNVTSAPAFAAELASSALAGFLGLSTDWGHALVVAAVVLLGLRLARPRALTPRMLGLPVAAVAFWLLVALGRAQFGIDTASAPRFVYTGVILTALLGAECFAGLRLRWRGLSLLALAALFALAGNIRVLREGAGSLQAASRTVSAELAALQLAHSTAPPSLVLDPHYAPQLIAGQYFTAIRGFGSSPAEPLPRLVRDSEQAREAADTVLIRAGALRVTRTPRASGSCTTLRPSAPSAQFELALPAGGLQLAETRGGGGATVAARRFAAAYAGPPLTALPSGAALSVVPVPDASAVPWHIRVTTPTPVSVCTR